MSGYCSGMYKEKKQFIRECLDMMDEIQQWEFVKQIKNPRAEHVFKERMGFYGPIRKSTGDRKIPTLDTLGETIGVTKTRVHQIEQYALDKAIGILGHVKWIARVHTDDFFKFVDEGLKQFQD